MNKDAKTMNEVKEMENQLVEVLGSAPINVGVMAMIRLIAAAGVNAGLSPEYMAQGIKIATELILEGRKKESGHAQN